MNFCGRYGYSFWPIWSFRVADVVVADMVCGRYGTDPLHPTENRSILHHQRSLATVHASEAETTQSGMTPCNTGLS